MATASAYSYQSQGILQENSNYIRIMTLLRYSERELYYKIFHDAQYGGFTTDPRKLYKQLKTHDMEIQALLNQKLITKDEYQLIFPQSQETYSQEFSVNVLYALVKHCVKKLPPVISTDEPPLDSPVTFSNEMEKLSSYNRDKKLRAKVIKSQKEFDECWDAVMNLLEKLGYDVTSVSELKTGYIEEMKQFRLAFLKAQVNLLIKEGEDLSKTTEVNSFALNKLMVNFNAALSESKEEASDQEVPEGDFEKLNTLKENVAKVLESISLIHVDLNSLKPQLKFWRDGNVEGDIIVLDDKLSKLRNEVNEQSSIVANMFSTVSLDIVKIKERLSIHVDNSKFIVSPELRRDRSSSRLSTAAREYSDSSLGNA